jgi:hypothetical protein
MVGGVQRTVLRVSDSVFYYVCRKCLSMVPGFHICKDMLEIRRRMRRMRLEQIRARVEKRKFVAESAN